MRPMRVPDAAAHLFIVNPLGNGGWLNLFRTHPMSRVPVEALPDQAFPRLAQRIGDRRRRGSESRLSFF